MTWDNTMVEHDAEAIGPGTADEAMRDALGERTLRDLLCPTAPQPPEV